MRQREKTSNLIHKKTPLVVAAIADREALSTPVDACDVIELRLDSLGSGPEVLAFAKDATHPLLITARGPIEGGQSDWTHQERAAAYQALIPFASLIDIELRDFDQFSEVIAEAKKSKIFLIGSFHDFEKTPPLDLLTAKLDDRADIHKFALMTKSNHDITTHLRLMEEFSQTPLSVMGMGPLGAAARPLMAKAGSLLNYGYLGSVPTAPNQWPAALLKEALAL